MKIHKDSLPQTRRGFLKSTAGLSMLGVAGGLPLSGSRSAAAPALTELSPSNEKIENGRKAALLVLKSSARDLEHGLELHANSLVFDAYGFSPSAAPDAERYHAAFKSGASDDELRDLEEEMPAIRA